LSLTGRLILGEEMETFRGVMERLVAAGRTRVAVGLQGVDYIDSSGLGCLVMQHTRISKVGGVMVLFALKRRAIELMVLTKLATVFHLAENELDAVNACFPDRDPKPFDILSFVSSQKKDGVTE